MEEQHEEEDEEELLQQKQGWQHQQHQQQHQAGDSLVAEDHRSLPGDRVAGRKEEESRRRPAVANAAEQQHGWQPSSNTPSSNRVQAAGCRSVWECARTRPRARPLPGSIRPPPTACASCRPSSPTDIYRSEDRGWSTAPRVAQGKHIGKGVEGGAVGRAPC